MNTIMIYLPIVMAIIGLLFMWIKDRVLKQDAGDGNERDFRLHL
jgi:K(+)-stimulated pyrophosphate-energized sodium pump